ncbi:CorA family divalent cation transporter [Zavarzinia sp. CC-PAN008]|uniref:CorA family divalent cation transporter n=1 Tax=Zavarzinia sp. CC-PAN008 TaxID=3243332 RepID=UPI003F746A62
MKETGLLHALLLDGRRGARPIALDDVGAWTPEQGTLWLHFSRKTDEARAWLASHAGIDPLLLPALLDDEVRPRLVPSGAGLLVVLRAVNVGSALPPEDMPSLRLWVTRNRVISVRHRPILAAQDLRVELADGRGPHDAGSLLCRLLERVLDRMHPLVYGLDEAVSTVEHQLVDDNRDDRAAALALSDIRRKVVQLRRNLAPMRDVLILLPQLEVPFLSTKDRRRLREIGERLSRFVEEIDTVRERAAVARDELAALAVEQTERTSYLLSLVATVFLPLGLIPSILGVNLGGIPGTQEPWAFWALCVALVFLGFALVALFKRWRWL